MQEYEFVTRAEYAPVKDQLNKIIQKIQSIMDKEYNMTFRWQLIGSGDHNLITRVVGGNGGYDFDYNFIIPAPDKGKVYLADVVKAQFMEAVKKALARTRYKNPSDSSSAITIKVVDRANSRIVHGCDFAIVYYDNNDERNAYNILKHNKAQNTYAFEPRPLSRQLGGTIEAIRQYYVEGWNLIREEYKKLKNTNNDANKRSSVLFLEAVNNVYNWILQEQEAEDDCYDDDDDE